MLDIIGDVHGHADSLEALLRQLGYHHHAGAWRHPERTAIFVGDLIDRGPGQLRTLRLVRDMMEAGAAEVVMGNHELNAIAWSTPDPSDDERRLRPRHGERGLKNRRQHQAFLTEVGEDTAEHRAWIDWFLELPLWIERPELRVIHACWDPASVQLLRPKLRDGVRLTPELVVAAHRPGSPIRDAIEVLLKGPERELPSGYSFTDKDGHVRTAIRTRWWDRSLTTFKAAYIGPDGVDIPNVALPAEDHTYEPDRPTFIGHYWLNAAVGLAPLTPKVACVDYSVARAGPLVAYRFDGEAELSPNRFLSAY